MASAAQKKGLEVCLISAFTSDPPGLIGDSFRIKQVLLNLLSNAVKFTSKGTVTVRWSHETRKENKIFISLIVEDTVCAAGSSEEIGSDNFRGSVFPRRRWTSCSDHSAKSTKALPEATAVVVRDHEQDLASRQLTYSGLGLVISRDLANLMGGDCQASSEYGKGSRFVFTFLAERDEQARTSYEVFRSPRYVLDPSR